jgi:hypothetical protein
MYCLESRNLKGLILCYISIYLYLFIIILYKKIVSEAFYFLPIDSWSLQPLLKWILYLLNNLHQFDRYCVDHWLLTFLFIYVIWFVMVVFLCHCSVQSFISESICIPLLESLLHWLTCVAFYWLYYQQVTKQNGQELSNLISHSVFQCHHHLPVSAAGVMETRNCHLAPVKYIIHK